MSTQSTSNLFIPTTNYINLQVGDNMALEWIVLVLIVAKCIMYGIVKIVTGCHIDLGQLLFGVLFDCPFGIL